MSAVLGLLQQGEREGTWWLILLPRVFVGKRLKMMR